MRFKLKMLIMMATTITSGLNAQQLDKAKLRFFEHKLDDVMELTDTSEVKTKLEEVQFQYEQNASELATVRLGIIYHETALNLSFLSNSFYKGYAKKSFDQLTILFNSPSTTRELMPFVASYRASALSLIVAETRKLKPLGEAFVMFDDAIRLYGDVSYLPEFLRGSVAENLPWFFLKKRKSARQDFQSIIMKHNLNDEYASDKIMSFTYLAWAKQHSAKKYREQAVDYLTKAIQLDPNDKAARTKAEKLRLTWVQRKK